MSRALNGFEMPQGILMVPMTLSDPIVDVPSLASERF